MEGNKKLGLKSNDRKRVPREYRGWLDTHIPTLPEILKQAGYATYMSGKWHLASEKQETWPTQRGFDLFYGHLSGTSGYFQPYSLHRQTTPCDQEGDHFYLTDALAEEAIRYLTDHDAKNDETPFFLYLAFNAPHFPLQSMPEDYEKYRGRFKAGWDVLRAEKLARQKALGIVPQNTQLSARPGNIPAWDSLPSEKQNDMDGIMATYAGMVDRIDQNIGKLLDHLKKTGELDNTLILFLSDNGAEAESEVLGRFKPERFGIYNPGKSGQPPWAKYGKAWANFSNTPCREYKHYAHQGGIQTPLVVQWPNGIAAQQNGRILSQNSYLPDLMETCLDVAGAPRPKTWKNSPVPPTEGKSLLGVLNGSSDPLHTEPIMIEHEGNSMVRHGDWKLVKSFRNDWELFNIEDDFSETKNMISAFPDIAERLEKSYMEWTERVGVIDWETAKEWDIYKK